MKSKYKKTVLTVHLHNIHQAADRAQFFFFYYFVSVWSGNERNSHHIAWVFFNMHRAKTLSETQLQGISKSVTHLVWMLQLADMTVRVIATLTTNRTHSWNCELEVCFFLKNLNVLTHADVLYPTSYAA